MESSIRDEAERPGETRGAHLPEVTTHRDAPAQPADCQRAQDLLFGPVLGGPVGEWSECGDREKIDRFDLQGRLWYGGMGIVYQAFDPELGREVAIKILYQGSSESGAARSRLLREAQAMARLSHPNVLTVYESGTYEGLVYIAMELVEGVGLRKRCAQANSWREVVELFRDAAHGLAAAHAVPLIHRDFKPENVIVGNDGRVRVLGSGLARICATPASGMLAESRAASTGTGSAGVETAEHTGAAPRRADPFLVQTLTSTGPVMGPSPYMAPEQLSDHVASPRSDQYSFCVALYEVLHGILPFASSGSSSTTTAECVDAPLCRELRPAPKGTKGAGAPAAIRSLIRRGLSANPDKRFPSMDALIVELDRALARGRRRRRLLTTTGIISVALFSGYLGAKSPESAETCAGWAASMSEDVWSSTRRAALAEAFARSGVPQAMPIWEIIDERVDAYVDTWRRIQRDACSPNQSLGPQGQRLAELRSACLSNARGELNALLAVMNEPEQTIVFHGIQAVGDLPSLARCSDDEVLLATVPLPQEPAVATAVERARAKASEIRALRRAGLYSRALAEVEVLRESVDRLDYLPLKAEFELLLGQIEFDNAHFDAAQSSYERAYWVGIDTSHDGVAVPAAINLAALLGERQASIEAGLAWTRQAEASLRHHASSELQEVALEQARGRILRVAGRPEEARKHLDAAHQRIYSINEADDFDIAVLLRDLSLVAIDQGHPDEAIKFHTDALMLARRAFGEEHPLVGTCLSMVGSVHHSISRYEEACRYFDEALDLFARVYGDSHPEIANTLNSLGMTYDKLERSEEAEEAYRRALAIRREHLGDAHPDVAATLDNLARSHVKRGKLDEAGAMMMSAEEILRRTFGPEHPQVAANLLSQADLAHRRGELEKARGMAVDARKIYIATEGGEHPDVACALLKEAAVLIQAGSPEAALGPARRALEIRSRVGMSPALAAEARLRVGQALWRSGGDRQAARAMIREGSDAIVELPELRAEFDAWIQEEVARSGESPLATLQ